VVHLGLVKQALEQGHRPANIFDMDIASLQSILASTATLEPSSPSPLTAQDLARVKEWMYTVEALDADTFDRLLLRSLADLGVLDFLERAVTPFLTSVGDRWSDGKFSIYHEHFASARLLSFMDTHWRQLSSGAIGPRAVLACLPGEQHVGGLHMAAWILARQGWRVVFLGANCPILDIVHAVEQSRASAVGVSVSLWADPVVTKNQLSDLLDTSVGITLLLGGGGSFEHPRCFSFKKLAQLDSWAGRHGSR
jgi:methanogenic corrinoid protein MtbC1